jgi:tryptophan synthase alpha chain
MSRIDDQFAKLRANGQKALIPFIEAGDPDLETTEALIPVLEASGADLIELGVPFSDPLADGPTIQKAALRALESGTSLKKILDLVKGVRSRVSVPLVLMSSYNPIFVFGEADFVRAAVASGVDGIIVPDLPPEEAESLISLAEDEGLDLIFLLAPSSTDDRVEMVAGLSRGFIYYISLMGITGARKELSDTIMEHVGHIKGTTERPVVVGFGISDVEQAREVAAWADGVVVGSAVVKLIEEAVPRDELCRSVGEFVRELKEGVLEASAG